MNKIIITNNPLIKNRLSTEIKVNYLENQMYIDVLVKVENYILNNAKLLIHPLYGNIKPNETPYRSILLKISDSFDVQSYEILVKAIDVAKKISKNRQTPNWNESIKIDFQEIDYCLIKNAIKSTT